MARRKQHGRRAWLGKAIHNTVTRQQRYREGKERGQNTLFKDTPQRTCSSQASPPPFYNVPIMPSMALPKASPSCTCSIIESTIREPSQLMQCRHVVFWVTFQIQAIAAVNRNRALSVPFVCTKDCRGPCRCFPYPQAWKIGKISFQINWLWLRFICLNSGSQYRFEPKILRISALSGASQTSSVELLFGSTIALAIIRNTSQHNHVIFAVVIRESHPFPSDAFPL